MSFGGRSCVRSGPRELDVLRCVESERPKPARQGRDECNGFALSRDRERSARRVDFGPPDVVMSLVDADSSHLICFPFSFLVNVCRFDARVSADFRRSFSGRRRAFAAFTVCWCRRFDDFGAVFDTDSPHFRWLRRCHVAGTLRLIEGPA